MCYFASIQGIFPVKHITYTGVNSVKRSSSSSTLAYCAYINITLGLTIEHARCAGKVAGPAEHVVRLQLITSNGKTKND